MKSSSLPYWLALIVILVAGYGFARVWRSERPTPLAGYGSAPLSPEQRVAPNEPPIEAFTLTDQQDQTFNSQSLDGQVWVASFFFTNCPSACVRLNQALAGVQQTAALDDVSFVSITCDPETDTPAVLAQYAEKFQAEPARWHFCTGDFEYIKRIGLDRMKLSVGRQMHANHAVVIDRGGKVRGRFNVLDERELAMMQQVLLECLAEEAPTETSAITPAAPANDRLGPGPPEPAELEPAETASPTAAEVGL